MLCDLRKAKRLDNGEWVEGNLILSEDTEKEFQAIIVPVCDSNMYTSNDETKLGFEIWHKVDPKTICRCTGKTDKNAKLIWENDICNCPKRGVAFYHCVVKWNPTKMRFDVVNIDEISFPMTLDEIGDDIAINALDYEVLGNSIDNPEIVW